MNPLNQMNVQYLIHLVINMVNGNTRDDVRIRKKEPKRQKVKNKASKMKKLTKLISLTNKRKGRLPLTRSNDIPQEERAIPRADLAELGMPEGSRAIDMCNPEHDVCSCEESLLNPLNKKKNKLQNLANL